MQSSTVKWQALISQHLIVAYISLETRPSSIYQISIEEVCPQWNRPKVIRITYEIFHLQWNLNRLLKNAMCTLAYYGLRYIFLNCHHWPKYLYGTMLCFYSGLVRSIANKLGATRKTRLMSCVKYAVTGLALGHPGEPSKFFPPTLLYLYCEKSDQTPAQQYFSLLR